jgi:hypothetical protein
MKRRGGKEKIWEEERNDRQRKEQDGEAIKQAKQGGLRMAYVLEQANGLLARQLERQEEVRA